MSPFRDDSVSWSDNDVMLGWLAAFMRQTLKGQRSYMYRIHFVWSLLSLHTDLCELCEIGTFYCLNLIGIMVFRFSFAHLTNKYVNTIIMLDSPHRINRIDV